jgi:hypothetical protein
MPSNRKTMDYTSIRRILLLFRSPAIRNAPDKSAQAMRSNHRGPNNRSTIRECAACLDVLVAKTMIDQPMAIEGKGMLLDIVLMLVGLIRTNSPSRNV